MKRRSFFKGLAAAAATLALPAAPSPAALLTGEVAQASQLRWTEVIAPGLTGVAAYYIKGLMTRDVQ